MHIGIVIIIHRETIYKPNAVSDEFNASIFNAKP